MPSILKEDSELSEELFVESSLHCLFEGIHETTIIKMFPPVLTKLKVMMPVHHPWNRFLIKAKLSKASWMNLFCFAKSGDGKSSPKTHSCAGWIGVNHLSCARLLKAGFYYLRSHLFPTDEDAEDVDVAKSHILDLMEAIVQTCHSMVSRLMQKTIRENEIHAIKEHTKLLLQLMLMFNLFNDPNSKTLPTICSRGNGLGLMNLIAQMMIHGSCRNIWDGDSEKLIQFVKGYLENRRRAVCYHALCLQNLLQDSALDTLISDLQGFYKKEFQCQDEMGPQSSRAG